MPKTRRTADAEPDLHGPEIMSGEAGPDAGPDGYRPSPAWKFAYCGLVLTARDIMRALEGGPAACGRVECRKADECRNEAREKACAKKLSHEAQNIVHLMMLFAAKLDPQDVRDFYFGEDRFAASCRPVPVAFDAATRGKLWPMAR